MRAFFAGRVVPDGSDALKLTAMQEVRSGRQSRRYCDTFQGLPMVRSPRVQSRLGRCRLPMSNRSCQTLVIDYVTLMGVPGQSSEETSPTTVFTRSASGPTTIRTRQSPVCMLLKIKQMALNRPLAPRSVSSN